MNRKEGLSILILHAHWNNRGDESAIRAMIDSLRSRLPVRKMRIMMFAIDVAQFPYDDIEVLKPYPNRTEEVVDGILALLLLGRKSFTKNGKSFIDAVDEADVVIHAPGGPAIGDIYRRGILSYLYLYRLFFANVIRRKPVFFYAPSMGPFTIRYLNPFRRWLLRRANTIILREAISARYLDEQLGLKSIVTCDSALQNMIPDEYLERYDNLAPILRLIEESRVVGLTVTDLRWHPVYGGNIELAAKIKQSLSETIEYLIDKEYRVLLIPQIFGEASDIPLLEQFRKLNENQIFILPDNIDSYGQQVVISKLHSMIGLRYHSNIFAAKGKIPFISIYYEHKMKGFMDELGLDELAINVEELTAQKIISKYGYLDNNYAMIKKILNERVPRLQDLSRQTTDIIVARIKTDVLQ